MVYISSPSNLTFKKCKPLFESIIILQILHVDISDTLNVHNVRWESKSTSCRLYYEINSDWNILILEISRQLWRLLVTLRSENNFSVCSHRAKYEIFLKSLGNSAAIFPFCSFSFIYLPWLSQYHWCTSPPLLSSLSLTSSDITVWNFLTVIELSHSDLFR